MIFFLIYSFTTRTFRAVNLGIDMPVLIESLEEQGKSEKEIEEFVMRNYWAKIAMVCSSLLMLIMLIGVCYRKRFFFYIIPWVVTLDKALEYPITGNVLSPYANLALAFFSQSSIF